MSKKKRRRKRRSEKNSSVSFPGRNSDTASESVNSPPTSSSEEAGQASWTPGPSGAGEGPALPEDREAKSKTRPKTKTRTKTRTRTRTKNRKSEGPESSVSTEGSDSGSDRPSSDPRPSEEGSNARSASSEPGPDAETGSEAAERSVSETEFERRQAEWEEERDRMRDGLARDRKQLEEAEAELASQRARLVDEIRSFDQRLRASETKIKRRLAASDEALRVREDQLAAGQQSLSEGQAQLARDQEQLRAEQSELEQREDPTHREDQGQEKALEELRLRLQLAENEREALRQELAIERRMSLLVHGDLKDRLGQTVEIPEALGQETQEFLAPSEFSDPFGQATEELEMNAQLALERRVGDSVSSEAPTSLPRETLSPERPQPLSLHERVQAAFEWDRTPGLVAHRSISSGVATGVALSVLFAVGVLSLTFQYARLSDPASEPRTSSAGTADSVSEVVTEAMEVVPWSEFELTASSEEKSDTNNTPPLRVRQAARENSRLALSRLHVVESVTRMSRRGLQACWSRARERKALAPGQHSFVLGWTITSEGKVENALVLPSEPAPESEIGDAEMRACMEAIVETWKFAQASTPSVIRNFPYGPVTVR